eukprot:TRINITY_DN11114_c0_g1_i1.p2 TRINITY_DN11114_c0_g1~~TRINITY_DN11114_c0_g1_i1.p2  ORF type:complete len:141 (-),score=17.52 TRINITY_DN11114_c0_g1_i1:264-686(-)
MLGPSQSQSRWLISSSFPNPSYKPPVNVKLPIKGAFHIRTTLDEFDCNQEYYAVTPARVLPLKLDGFVSTWYTLFLNHSREHLWGQMGTSPTFTVIRQPNDNIRHGVSGSPVFDSDGSFKGMTVALATKRIGILAKWFTW